MQLPNVKTQFFGTYNEKNLHLFFIYDAQVRVLNTEKSISREYLSLKEFQSKERERGSFLTEFLSKKVPFVA